MKTYPLLYLAPLTIALALFASSLAHADGPSLGIGRGSAMPARDSSKTILAETTYVDADRENPLRASPATTRISPERLAHSTFTTLTEMLTYAPGVSVSGTGGWGATQSVFIRGAGPSEVGILLDGVPINGPELGAYDLSGYSPTLLGAIDVTRGAISGLSGSDAMGGAINLLPRRATEHSPLTDMGIFWGRHGQRQIDLAMGNRFSNGVHLRVGYVRLDDRGDRSVAGTSTIDSVTTPTTAQAKYGADEWSATAGWDARDSAFVGDVTVLSHRSQYTIIDPVWSLIDSTDYNGHDGAATQKNVNYTVIAKGRGRISESVHVGGWLKRERLLQHYDDTDGYTPHYRYQNDLTGGELGADWRSTHATLGGWAGYEGLVTQSDLAYHVPANRLWARLNATGTFDALALVGGARWDQAALNSDTVQPTRPLEPGHYRIALPRTLANWSGFVAASYALPGALMPTVHASARLGYRFPNQDELFTSFGNPDLKRERSGTEEIGLAWKETTWTASLVGYATDYTNLVQYAPPDYAPYNVARAFAKGVEAAAEAHLGTHHLVGAQMALGDFEAQSVAAIAGTDTTWAHRELAYRPKLTWGAHARGEYLIAGNEITLDWRVDVLGQGAVRTEFNLAPGDASAHQSVERLPGRILANGELGGEYAGFRLYLREENLGDLTYERRLGYPGDRRNFIVGMRWALEY